jgi:hypothetical protein
MSLGPALLEALSELEALFDTFSLLGDGAAPLSGRDSPTTPSTAEARDFAGTLVVSETEDVLVAIMLASFRATDWPIPQRFPRRLVGVATII